MTSPQPTPAASRHGFVDALRGFALLGILVVNIEFIIQPSEIGWVQFDSALDQAVRWFIVTFGQTKIYPIFATLFGYGLSLQLRRSGPDLWPRYRRRMIALIVLGVLHGLFFFPGDILVIYALIGLAAFRLRNTPTPKLLKIAAWTYGIATAFWLALSLLELLGSPATSSPYVIPDAYLSGSFIDVAAENFWLWVFTLLVLIAIQGPAVVASFAIGIALGRTDLLADPDANRLRFATVLRWLPIAVVVAGVGGWLTVFVERGDTMGFVLGFAAAPLMAAGYVALLARVVGSGDSGLASLLQASGRMSLTIYLLESIVSAFLAYDYGVGLLPGVGPLGGLALALFIWLGLSLFSVVWMKSFRFGPFEWVLRSVSYRTPQPMARSLAGTLKSGRHS